MGFYEEKLVPVIKAVCAVIEQIFCADLPQCAVDVARPGGKRCLAEFHQTGCCFL